jgi:pimeloyl-ACP methyl ester carboxylesterase
MYIIPITYHLRVSLFVPLLAMSLAACQPTIHLMRPPVSVDAEYDPYQLTPQEFRTGSIRMAYATNRKSGEPGSSDHYVRQFDQDLRFGLAFVQIATGEESWDQILEWSTNSDRQERIPLSLTGVERRGLLPHTSSIDELSPDLQRTFNGINDYIKQNPIKDITVYVHGANANFYRAAAQAAQYRHFSGRTDLLMFYAWPTGENFLRYSTDLRNVQATVPVFARFIRLLSKHTIAERINILAYSAGAQLATDALAFLGSDTEEVDRKIYRDKLRLGSIYLVGGDVELGGYTQSLRQFVDLTENVTITINEQDFVLKLSKWFSRKSRAGSPDIEELDEEMIDWSAALSRSDDYDVIYIDPGVIPDVGVRSHDYWYTSSWVSSDALLLLNFRAMPLERGLEPLTTDSGYEIWTFPPDYNKRIATSLEQLVFPKQD